MHDRSFTLVPHFILTVWALLFAGIVFVVSNWRRGKRIAAAARRRGWRYTKNGKCALARYLETHPFPLSFGYRVRHLAEFTHNGFGVESFGYCRSRAAAAVGAAP